MPEKGWKNVTIRQETKVLLIREAGARGVSINDLIIRALSELSV